MGLSKRLDDARKAFNKGDKAAAERAHDPRQIVKAAREEHGGSGSQYIGDLVFGGLDGIITTFAVVSGVSGASLGSAVILILGLANLLADGFSMATGAYLSTKSEQEYYDKERERETWEVEHFPEGERVELVEVYVARGYSEAEARQLVEIHSRDKTRWVDAMMVDELAMLREERNPLKSGLATFIAFVLAGAVPMLVYLLGLVVHIPAGFSFPIAVVLSATALFGLGAAKVRVTGHDALRSGVEMLAIGGLAAVVAYGIGALLKGLGA